MYTLPASSKFWLKNSLYNTAAELHQIASDVCFFQDCIQLLLKHIGTSSIHKILMKGTLELNCALHKGAVSLLHFEPATCLPQTCVVLWFQHSISGLFPKLSCGKSRLQTQQCYVAHISVGQMHRRWCYFHTTPLRLSRMERLLAFWSVLLTVSGFLVFMDRWTWCQGFLA